MVPRPCAMVTAMVCMVAALLLAGCASDAEPAASEVATAAETATVAAVATTAPPAEPSASVALPPPTALVVPTPQPPTPVPTVAPTAEPEPVAAVESPSSEAAPTAAPAPGSNQSLEGRIANGAEVYTLNCARCHAENGTGTERYSGLIGVGSRYSTAGMTAELTTGHPVTFGFADRLSADEIASVVAYVKATFP